MNIDPVARRGARDELAKPLRTGSTCLELSAGESSRRFLMKLANHHNRIYAIFCRGGLNHGGVFRRYLNSGRSPLDERRLDGCRLPIKSWLNHRSF